MPAASAATGKSASIATAKIARQALLRFRLTRCITQILYGKWFAIRLIA
jgi:hypothetical protein